MWGIGAKALREFIRRYPQDLDGRNVDLIAVVDAGRPSAAVCARHGAAQAREPGRRCCHDRARGRLTVNRNLFDGPATSNVP